MLELKQISKRFGDKQILSDFNLLVPEKQIVAIVGPSGGGKTTLLRMLAGLETIDSGQIVYNGENLPLDALEKRNLLGFVFQDFQLFPHLSVMENLILSPIKTMNVTKEEASKKAMSYWSVWDSNNMRMLIPSLYLVVRSNGWHWLVL